MPGLIPGGCMTITNIPIALVVLGVAGYFGWLRPTGLASRNSAEREEDDDGAEEP